MKDLVCWGTLPGALAAIASCTTVQVDPFGSGLGETASGTQGPDSTPETEGEDESSSDGGETDAMGGTGTDESGGETAGGECMDGQSEACYGGAPSTVDVGECVAGTRTCSEETWSVCAGEVIPILELCNGLDDDCDGMADEDNPGGGDACATGEPGVCATGMASCVGGMTSCERTVNPSMEICGNGIDEDCDGTPDNGCMACPFIYGHDGAAYRYETSAGGSSLVGHKRHLARGRGKPVRFDPLWSRLDHAAVQSDGSVRAKVLAAEDEIVYLDHAALTVVEHPAGHEVISASALQRPHDEGAAQFLAFETAAMRVPDYALWQGRHDVTRELGHRNDRAAAYDRGRRNFYELDFGPRGEGAAAFLVVDGWKYKERRKGLKRKHRGQRPRIQIEDANGRWRTVMQVHTPRGDRKTVCYDLSHLAWAGDRYRLRLWTGTHERGMAMWYLDRVRLTEQRPVEPTVRHVAVSSAELTFRGAPTMIDPADHGHPRFNVDDGGGELRDEERTFGRFTRYGDVAPLLTQPDNCLVVMRRGDAVDLRFEGVEPPGSGHVQSLFLHTELVFKPRVAPAAREPVRLTRRVGPLPSRGMGRYGNDAPEPDATARAYVARWNTRVYRRHDRHWGRAAAHAA